MKTWYLSYDLENNSNDFNLDDPLTIADVLIFNKVYDIFGDEIYFSDKQMQNKKNNFIFYPSERAFTNIIKDLPVFSVSRINTKLAGYKDTYIASSQARKLKFKVITKQLSGKQREPFEILSEVMPITLIYNVSFWTRYYTDMNRMLLALNNNFGKTRIIPIPIDYFLYYDSVEKKYRPMTSMLTIDTSPITTDFTSPDSEDRILQSSFTFTYEYYYLAKSQLLPYQTIILDLIATTFDKLALLKETGAIEYTPEEFINQIVIDAN